MQVRSYKSSDYKALIDLYGKSDEFKVDKVTDSEANISRKIEKDPESLLVVEDNGQIVGSVSIIEDGRIALLFRLVAVNTNKEDILKMLLAEAESILKKRSYAQMHNTAPTNDLNAIMERNKLGFKQGDTYTWCRKELE
jgi:hypothetical protein